MTYSRYSQETVLYCDNLTCTAEVTGSSAASAEDLRKRARSGFWVHRNHHDYCRNCGRARNLTTQLVHVRFGATRAASAPPR